MRVLLDECLPRRLKKDLTGNRLEASLLVALRFAKAAVLSIVLATRD
jgi:predicted nuclease of predicted toxin-antitoxin system